MDLPRPIANLIDRANNLAATGAERLFNMEAMIITPEAQIKLILPNGFARLSLFGINHADDAQIKAQIQPGVYLQYVLPHKDNLFIEITELEGYHQTLKRYRAIPLGDTNPEMQGQNSALAALATKDDLNMVTVTFQLIETGYAILKNQLISDIHLMAKLDDVLHYQLTQYGEMLELTDEDAFKGVTIERPLDNDRIFKQVVIPAPAGITLPKLAQWLQANEEFGIYSTGIGSYYRKGMWYIYPLFRLGRYEKAAAVLDIYRLPENVFPTLRSTYFIEGRSITILSTGKATVRDGKDIDRQNVGTGKRVISPDALMGEVGTYYGRGQAVTTRNDSLSEYKTANRGSGEELIPYHPTPTNNLCKLLSQNAYNDGSEVTISWHNSNGLLITPGMPLRYYYMSGTESLMYKEGVVLTVRTEYRLDTQSTKPVFREHSALTLFISKEEKPAEEVF